MFYAPTESKNALLNPLWGDAHESFGYNKLSTIYFYSAIWTDGSRFAFNAYNVCFFVGQMAIGASFASLWGCVYRLSWYLVWTKLFHGVSLALIAGWLNETSSLS